MRLHFQAFTPPTTNIQFHLLLIPSEIFYLCFFYLENEEESTYNRSIKNSMGKSHVSRTDKIEADYRSKNLTF